jgi:hypothetical protein
MALNPQKYIRSGIISALPGYRVWNNRVPRNVETPKLYILITNQSKNEYAVGKQCHEWECQFTLQLIYRNDLGFDSSAIVDDAAQVVDDVIRYQMQIPNFFKKNVTLDQERDDTYDTATNTINRKLLSYSIWVNNAD